MEFLHLFENHFKLVLPELYLACSILFLLLVGVWSKTKVQEMSWLALYVLLVVSLLIWHNPFGYETVISLFHDMFVVDSLTTFVKLLVLAGTFGSILVSIGYFASERLKAFEYPILLLLATLGLLLLISAYDLLSLYLALELQALSLYILAAFKRDSEFSTEAGLKYFILGAFSSGLLLFGISMIYGFTGVTHINDLSVISLITGSSYGGILVGMVLAGVALLFKIAAVPFHMWVPDVYEGAPTPVTTFFAVTPKIGVIAAFFRLYFQGFYGLFPHWQSMVIVCSIASMVVGLLGALYQTKIKRLLAYSAISHVGYMLIGVSVGTPEGIQSLLLYSTLYMVSILGVFAILLSLKQHRYQVTFKYITDLSGLAKLSPALAFALAILLFSLAGIPPLAGFYGKLYLFLAALQSSMYPIALVGLFASVGGALYYIRLIKLMYFEDPVVNSQGRFALSVIVDAEKSFVISLSTLITVLFCCYPTGLFTLTYRIGYLFCQ